MNSIVLAAARSAGQDCRYPRWATTREIREQYTHVQCRTEDRTTGEECLRTRSSTAVAWGARSALVHRAGAPPVRLRHTRALGALGTVFAFSDWDGISADFDLIGFGNFVEVFTDPLATAALVNTFVFAAVTMILQNGLGLLLALALNTVVKSGGLLRTIFFAPVVLTPLVCGYIWSYLLAPTGGVNAVLGALGLDSLQQNWLGDPQFALGAVCVAYLWQFTGFSMVIYLAGLKALPSEVIEAAVIDGAGPVRRFFSVVLPLITERSSSTCS